GVLHNELCRSKSEAASPMPGENKVREIHLVIPQRSQVDAAHQDVWITAPNAPMTVVPHRSPRLLTVSDELCHIGELRRSWSLEPSALLLVLPLEPCGCVLKVK